MLKVNKDTVLTPKLLKRILDDNNSSRARLVKLENYYLGKHEILRRQMADISKPNNKIVNAYPSYISDVLTAYFMAEPISYSSEESALLDELQAIFTYNDEQDENMCLARDASVFGVGYELSYVDENGDVRFKKLDPKDCIAVYDDTIEEDLVFFIRYYLSYDLVQDKKGYMIEVYDKQKTSYFKSNENLGDIALIEEKPHFFNLVPIAIYKNNDYQIGDFEPVLSLIDAYDKLESDSLNDFEYFCDAYLALYGFTADDEDAAKMKANRMLLMDEGTKAEWLIKNAPDTTIENMKNRIDADIHRFSKCPDLLDESFAGNSSGVAIKYKLMATENIAGTKERKFKKGLQRRLELIAAISGLKSGEFDWKSIEIIFTRSLPANDLEAADLISKLSGIVSDETLLSQLSFVDNVAQELKKIKKQKEQDPMYDKGLTFENLGKKEEEEIVE